MINLCDENSPLFKEENHNFGKPTERIIYNPVFSKIFQGRTRPLIKKKWLVVNKDNPDRCPVRYDNNNHNKKIH